MRSGSLLLKKLKYVPGDLNTGQTIIPPWSEIINSLTVVKA